jgi:hypothetical protein
MKQCPQCGTTYTDDSLHYCLADGKELLHIDNEQGTVAAPRDQKLRVDIDRAEPVYIPTTTSPKSQSSSVAKIVVVIALLGFLVIVAVGGIGALVYFGKRNNPANTNTNIAASTSSTPDPEKQRMQDELANLQRRLDEQQKNANRVNAASPSPPPGSPGVVTARVNSANDGFLALRDKPDADRGERLVKIPHGSIVTIQNCNRNKVIIGGRSGRWCFITWGDYEGYVFDAWLVY